jgi:cytochrome c
MKKSIMFVLLAIPALLLYCPRSHAAANQVAGDGSTGSTLIAMGGLGAMGGGMMMGSAAQSGSAGETVFKDAKCGMCHSADSSAKKMGPGLKGLFQHKKLANGEAVTDENVRAIITKGAKGMPPMGAKLSKKQIDDLMAYLHTL